RAATLSKTDGELNVNLHSRSFGKGGPLVCPMSSHTLPRASGDLIGASAPRSLRKLCLVTSLAHKSAHLSISGAGHSVFLGKKKQTAGRWLPRQEYIGQAGTAPPPFLIFLLNALQTPKTGPSSSHLGPEHPVAPPCSSVFIYGQTCKRDLSLS